MIFPHPPSLGSGSSPDGFQPGRSSQSARQAKSCRLSGLLGSNVQVALLLGCCSWLLAQLAISGPISHMRTSNDDRPFYFEDKGVKRVDEDTPKDKKNVTPEQAVADVVQKSQKAGWVEQKIDQYMAAWATDARLVQGRGEKPDRYDVAIGRKQLEALRRLQFAACRHGNGEISFENVKVSIEGNTAELRHQVVWKQGVTERGQEIYQLRCQNDRWLIVSCRYWPVAREGILTREAKLTPQVWAALDQQVQRATTPKQKTQTLYYAYRWPEALQAARAWTKKEPKKAQAWRWLGRLLEVTGEPEDALVAYRKARRLSPSVELPRHIDLALPLGDPSGQAVDQAPFLPAAPPKQSLSPVGPEAELSSELAPE